MHKNTILFWVFSVISLTVVIKCEDSAPVANETPETGEESGDAGVTEPAAPEPAAPTASSSPDTSASGEASNPALEYLKLHNDARQNASVPILTWDDSLFGKAKPIVDSCVIKENENFNSDFILDIRRSKKSSPKTIFAIWLKQGKKVKTGDYSKCCSQKTARCCRYAKVMSPKYTLLGCATNFCKTLTDNKKSHSNRVVTICYYGKK